MIFIINIFIYILINKMDILKLKEEYLKKQRLYKQSISNGQNISISEPLIKSNNFIEQVENIIQKISNKIDNIEYIDINSFDEIINILKNKSIEHNEKISNWFDLKYEKDINLLSSQIDNYEKQSNIYEKNCLISITYN